jgi:hypothetical protein
MTTSDLLTQRAIELVLSDVEQDEAVSDLLRSSDGRRVSAVKARQELMGRLDGSDEPLVLERAVQLMDQTLLRMPE